MWKNRLCLLVFKPIASSQRATENKSDWDLIFFYTKAQTCRLWVFWNNLNTQKMFCCCLPTLLINHHNFLHCCSTVLKTWLHYLWQQWIIFFTRKTSNRGTQSTGPRKVGVTGLPVASSLIYIFIQTCVFLFLTLSTIN